MTPSQTITRYLSTFTPFQVNYLEIKDDSGLQIAIGKQENNRYESQTLIEMTKGNGFQFFGFVSESDSNGDLVSLGAKIYNPEAYEAQIGLVRSLKDNLDQKERFKEESQAALQEIQRQTAV